MPSLACAHGPSRLVSPRPHGTLEENLASKVEVVAVALNIKNDEAQRLGRELSDLTGESITTAVTTAIRERLDRMRADREAGEQRVERIVALGRQIADAVVGSGFGIDDLYDDRGLPA
ncbi:MULTISPECIES: type II toxin-antitoxin system VapB family antitoxin [unclassified Frankia]|uniref:type II toxin-antitoxin system VapB family antitoxin n=1 Tax=unclassified Frankia TaxID=2632575 RepID=UPI00272ECA66|nr:MULTISPECIES: type II toxin-antitoxin system VapB family antitoxin [unclassified Frankia]